MSAAEALMKGNRLAAGKCPEHGKVLVTKGEFKENGETVGRVYKCPLDDCTFEVVARHGTRLMKLLR
jgi:hypothetical protein